MPCGHDRPQGSAGDVAGAHVATGSTVRNDSTKARIMTTTILIIDDDTATLEFLELLLSMSGYHVRTAATGEAGLRHAAREPFAAVLLDRRLPDFDGVALCARLRDHLGPDVPIIMLTADHEPTVEVAAHAAGVTSFLRKPFEPPVLLNRLTELLPA